MVNCYPCKVCACGWFVTDTSQAGVCRRCGHDEGQHEDVSCIKSTKPAPHSCIEFIYNGYCMKCNGKYKDLRIYLEIILYLQDYMMYHKFEMIIIFQVQDTNSKRHGRANIRYYAGNQQERNNRENIPLPTIHLSMRFHAILQH